MPYWPVTHTHKQDSMRRRLYSAEQCPSNTQKYTQRTQSSGRVLSTSGGVLHIKEGSVCYRPYVDWLQLQLFYMPRLAVLPGPLPHLSDYRAGGDGADVPCPASSETTAATQESTKTHLLALHTNWLLCPQQQGPACAVCGGFGWSTKEDTRMHNKVVRVMCGPEVGTQQAMQMHTSDTYAHMGRTQRNRSPHTNRCAHTADGRAGGGHACLYCGETMLRRACICG